MKKITFLFAALLSVIVCQAQNVNIPDTNFKAALVANFSINTNQDGEIQVSEATAFTGMIDVNTKNISNLTGIEAFTAISYLDCSYNTLTNLNISQNTALVQLYCYNNQLTNINVTQNSALSDLLCDQNMLSNIDVSQCHVLSRLDCSNNQLTSINVSQNPALITLSCSKNELINIDVSQNPALVQLTCTDNHLTSINTSQNPALEVLYCTYNELINIDVSQNQALTQLYCSNNYLTSLNVSQNPALVCLYCLTNQLTSINLSQNPELVFLNCSYNNLTFLNVRNGNNSEFTYFIAHNNPALFCIQVDDPIWSFAHWTDKDSWASYGSNCLYGIVDPNQITGRILLDNNCSQEGSEIGFRNIIVKTEPDNFYGITDSAGYYKIHTDTGTYNVKQLIPENNIFFINPLCPSPNYYTVSFDTLALDTAGLDFYNEGVACPYLKVDVNSDRRRRCFRNNTYIKYCNEGYANANNVQVHVQFPEYVNLISTDYAYTQDGEGNYIFDIDTLAQGACGTIHIVDSVSCELGITGLTQCTKTWITPTNNCVNNLDTIANNEWDKSSVSVEGVCVSDSSVRFTITNTGQFGEGDMDTPSEYRIYADNQLVFTGTFQLDGGEQLVLEVPANGQTIRLEADQHPAHPGNSHPRATVEACGGGGATISLGFVNDTPQDDEDAEVEISCMEIRDSFDPNDKSVSPQGITDHNYLMPGTTLEYQIRFQNTGSDTAYTIVVVDTLSTVFDVSTIEWGISSHPYVVDVSGYGKPVLKFTFNHINLPDSTTDESNSHGFVKFKIAPYDTLPMGSVIQNFADIYFDYNLPVRTNTTHQIISDTVPTGSLIKVINYDSQLFDFKAIPNPFSGQLMLDFGVSASYKVKIMDMLGKEVFSTEFSDTKGVITTSALPSGIYILQVLSEKGIGVKKIVKK